MDIANVELSGRLSNFRLNEIIQFLHQQHKKGELVLVDETGERASLFFDFGELVHVVTDSREGRRAFDAVIPWKSGVFVFKSGTVCEKRTIQEPMEVLLLESHRRIMELQNLADRLPSEDTVFHLLPDRNDELSLNAQEWKIITQLDGRRSIKQISEILQDEILVKNVLADLLEKRLISSESPRSKFNVLVPLPVTQDQFKASRTFPSRLRTNLIMKHIDGRTSIEQIRSRLGMEDGALIEDIKDLYDSHWIRFSPAEDTIFQNLRDEL
jgi:hypothetical protein